ncbi:hypothetical protein COW94_03230 [Candidatus Peregrinibacteria bacterium CG22_combo_CG10-13_8_21_14_all_44_10]|nr:MAG: hypothetical protein COW94_03230 [Candidatus Peregrinibacteria bacterium CG22_combo_CG10-13_8_21_14_all_44_10]
MAGGGELSTAGGTDDGVEVQYDSPSTLGVITLFDKREGLTEAELGESMRHVDDVFEMIKKDGAGSDYNPDLFPSGADEAHLAQATALGRVSVKENSSTFGRGLSEIINRFDKDDPDKNALLEFRRKIPAVEYSPFKTCIDNIAARRPDLIADPDSITELCRRLAAAHTALLILEDQKRAFLKKQMTDLVAEDRNKIESTVKRLVTSIQTCRKEQGRPLYPKDAIIMLVYEIVYNAYLWRGKQRKGSGQPIFDEHLIAAIEEAIANGRTGLARLITLLKHDDGEDLNIHQFNCDKESAQRDVKDDWICCLPLYVSRLSDEPVPDGNGGNVKPQTHALNVVRDVCSAVRGMTSDPKKKRLEADPDIAQAIADDQKASRHFMEMLNRPHVASCKALEQCSNAQTLIGLGAERGRAKWRRMIVPNAVVARAHSLEKAYIDLVGGGIDFFDNVDSKSVRANYNKLQRERILSFLGINNPSGRQSFLSRLSDVCGNPTTDSDVDSSSGCFDDIIAKWSSKFAACTSSNGHAVSIKIVPTPLEQYVDLSKLDDPTYTPEIPEADPLFHVLVLVDDRTLIDPTMEQLMAAVRPNLISSFGPIPSYQDQAPMGKLAYLEDDALGGAVQVRVNTSTDEALSRVGNMTKDHPIPEHMQGWLLQAQADAEEAGVPILKAVMRYVFRKVMAVTTDTSDGPRRTVLLPDGATGLDLAAHLPLSRWAEAFTHGDSVRRRYPRASTGLSPSTSRYTTWPSRLLGRLDDGDFALINNATTPVPEPRLLARLACCEDDRSRVMAARFFKDSTLHDGIYRTDTSLEQDRVKAHTDRALAYLETIIGPVLGINDREMIIFACMHILGVDPIEEQNDALIESQLSELRDVTIGLKHEVVPEVISPLERRFQRLNTDLSKNLSNKHRTITDSKFSSEKYLNARAEMLRRIGSGNFDPLKILALYFDRSVPLKLSFVANQKKGGVLADIYARAAAIGLSANPRQSGTVTDAGEAHFTIEWDMSKSDLADHDLLKFVLSFVDDNTTSSVRLDSSNVKFPSCFREVSNVVNKFEHPKPELPTQPE